MFSVAHLIENSKHLFKNLCSVPKLNKVSTFACKSVLGFSKRCSSAQNMCLGFSEVIQKRGMMGQGSCECLIVLCTERSTNQSLSEGAREEAHCQQSLSGPSRAYSLYSERIPYSCHVKSCREVVKPIPHY